jgi:hypothetical protein
MVKAVEVEVEALSYALTHQAAISSHMIGGSLMRPSYSYPSYLEKFSKPIIDRKKFFSQTPHYNSNVLIPTNP